MFISEPWIWLYLQPSKIIRAFYQYFSDHDNEHILASITPWLKKHGQTIDQQQFQDLVEWCKNDHQGYIPFTELPLSLQSIADPPVLLFYRGETKLLSETLLAVVGSRKPSPAGRENAQFFCNTLARSGLCLISGMARGIDGIAHQVCLDLSLPTIAVLGCGLNHCYPQGHKAMFESIAETGLLLSEYQPDESVKAWQFPRRNRIISGLSEGLLVIEAAMKSGSLVSAKLAAEQGRQVFAVPGDIHNSVVKGCHYLIREGAQLVTEPQEILSAIAWLRSNDIDPEVIEQEQCLLTDQEKTLLDIIDRTPRHVEQLISRSSMQMSLVLDLLFSLELKGRIISSADGYFKPRSR